MLVSLAAALVNLFRRGDEKTDRTFHWLVVRIALAIAIAVVIAIGLYSGQLGNSAPWRY
ncbi:DUF2909 family protein [Reinekea marinisedimentorum]|nr:DUF2909 family protein [Reinekea marinisedimentorum]